MGKLALVGVLGVIAIGGVGVRSSSPFVEGLCAALATLIALSIAGAVLWYSHKHPQEATLEGMEVIVMQQQKAWAAKTIDLSASAAPLIPNTGGLAPQLNPPEVIEE